MGLDVGTTSTQMIVSRLQIENRASEFAVPDLVISGRTVLYESPVHFTPLLSQDRIDGEQLRELVLAEYARAGITRESVDTGAVIVTGETSRKENAAQVTRALSDLAGDFVVAAAGPDLESVLAARGAGAVERSRETGKTILHMDIGGGTANLCLIRAGEIAATGCLNVGGRLVKLDPEGKVTYVSPVLAGLWDCPVGSVPGEERMRALAALLTHALEAAAGLREEPGLLKALTTEGTASLPLQRNGEAVIPSFSGGVADCIARDFPPLEFGDIGPRLGRAIRESALCGGEYLLGAQTIRATVIGAGCHSATLSGSTVFCRDVGLPLQNLRVLHWTPGTPPPVLPEEGGCLAMAGLAAPSYEEVVRLAEAIAEAYPAGPLLLCLEEDMAKALGQALAGRTKQPILCIDRVRLPPGSYLDVGTPTGPAFPVVVKTLVFGKEPQT